MLAMMGEGLLIEGLHDDLDLLLEHLAVGVVVRVGAGNAEGVHLPGVVAPANAENHPSVGQYVCRGVIFGQPQRVPHGIDVETTAEFQVLGYMGQVHVEEQQVGNHLIALMLEVVLRGPETVVVQVVHHFDDLLHPVEDRAQMVVIKSALVDGSRPQAKVSEIDVSGVQASKVLDHDSFLVLNWLLPF